MAARTGRRTGRRAARSPATRSQPTPSHRHSSCSARESRQLQERFGGGSVNLAVLTALALALAGGLAWLYLDAVRGLVVQWATSPDASYGAIIAAVALLIFWKRRYEFV